MTGTTRAAKSAVVGAARSAARSAAYAAKSAAGSAAGAAKSVAGRAVSRLQLPPSSRNKKIIQKILPADFTPRVEPVQEDFNQILGTAGATHINDFGSYTRERAISINHKDTTEVAIMIRYLRATRVGRGYYD